MEKSAAEWDQAAGRGKVEVAEDLAAWADPTQRDQSAVACARSAGKGNHINADFPALSGNARSAVLR